MRRFSARHAATASLLALLTATFLAGCDKDDDTPASPTPAASAPKRAACLGFNVTVTAGPDSGRTWDGDLMMTLEPSGYFTAVLVPVDSAVRATLTVTDSSTVMARATGQANGVSVNWILHFVGGEEVFGSGMIDLTVDPQTLRGITSGPTTSDRGVFHGRWFPPYIRTVS